MRSSPFIFLLSLGPPLKPRAAFDPGPLAGPDAIGLGALLRDLMHECMLDSAHQADCMPLEIRALRFTTAKINLSGQFSGHNLPKPMQQPSMHPGCHNSHLPWLPRDNSDTVVPQQDF